jgi:hypothetical protein
MKVFLGVPKGFLWKDKYKPVVSTSYLFHGEESHILCEQTRDTSGLGIVNDQR